MDEFVLRALVGALILAAMLGPLGAFVVWRRMAYFGDTIAHSALLGVGFSLLSGGAVPLTLAMFIVAMTVALILARLSRDTRFHTDTLLGMLAHGALATGVLLVALSRNIRVDINAYLFGDVLAVTWEDVAMLAGLAVVILGILYYRWRSLLMVTIDPAIAQVEGINVVRNQLLLTLMLAAVIAVAIKLTGVLLITALLIIPAASARYLAATPRQMALLASVFGMLGVSGGLFASLKVDAPTGPMMVVTAVVIFMVAAVVSRVRK